MLGQFILMTILFSNFIINTNGIDPVQDLIKLFQDIPENTYDKRELIQRITPFQSSHQQRKKDHSNLMNIESLNLFSKPQLRQEHDAELDRFLRTETDRICKETGRCGCSGSRCGDRTEDQVANEVDELVNEINKQLTTNDRNKIKGVVDSIQEENIFSSNKNADNHNDENLLKGKKIKLNDDVDVVVLEPKEIDELLKKQNFMDLTKNSIILDTDTGTLSSGPKNPDHFRELIAEIMKKAKSSNEKVVSYKNTNRVYPDDLFKYYETLKNQITNLFAYYVKNNQNEIPIEEHLTDYQLQLLEDLKLNYQRGDLKENKIKSEIVNVIFGKDSGTKILPHSKDSQNIYIPKQFYDDILKSKKINLRSTPKRILPLTFQQRNRLVTKDKGNTINKMIWRRNQRPEYQDLGIPFNLDVHGLGQLNPYQ